MSNVRRTARESRLKYLSVVVGKFILAPQHYCSSMFDMKWCCQYFFYLKLKIKIKVSR